MVRVMFTAVVSYSVTTLTQAENSETKTTPEQVWIRLSVAPPSLSRGRMIKMKKSINDYLVDKSEKE